MALAGRVIPRSGQSSCRKQGDADIPLAVAKVVIQVRAASSGSITGTLGAAPEMETTVHELVYVLRFSGHATPVGPAGGMIKIAATAPSCTIGTTIGPEGVWAEMRHMAGDDATLVSEVIFTRRATFQATGTIMFSIGHALHISTAGSGYLTAGHDPVRRHGGAIWRIEGGDGQFAQASGLVTSFLARRGRVDRRLPIGRDLAALKSHSFHI